jgi:hypothetical protein
MRRRRLTLFVFCSTLVLGACDRTPSDPLDARADLAALLSSDAAARAGAWTLPGLLHSAVHRVYTEHGPSAARNLVSELARLQQDSRRLMIAGDREAADAGIAAVQSAEVDLVLRVFGSAVVERTLAATRLDMIRLERGVAEAEDAGRDLLSSRLALVRAGSLLHTAEEQHAAGNAAAALAAATRAAAAVDGVRTQVADASRIPGLPELYDLAVARLRTADAVAARTVTARHAELRRAADLAVRDRDRDAAARALAAVRAHEIRVVVDVLGHESVQRLVQAVNRGIADVAGAAALARHDVSRFDRMIATARDMNGRARSALTAGDVHTALDLASHAAGLVNAARLGFSAQ